jgi:dephospho-CoA kinase
LKIAITGGIAEGKSTVLGYIQERGISTFSADDASRQVFETPAIQTQIASALGLVEPLTRDSVRHAMAQNPSSRRTVNAIMHGPIWELLRSFRGEVVEIPLLLEACLYSAFDRVWVVTCGNEEQLARLTRRLGNGAAAKKLLETQLPTTVKCAFADRIVRTNKNEATVKAYVTEAVVRDLQLGI